MAVGEFRCNLKTPVFGETEIVVSIPFYGPVDKRRHPGVFVIFIAKRVHLQRPGAEAMVAVVERVTEGVADCRFVGSVECAQRDGKGYVFQLAFVQCHFALDGSGW